MNHRIKHSRANAQHKKNIYLRHYTTEQSPHAPYKVLLACSNFLMHPLFFVLSKLKIGRDMLFLVGSIIEYQVS